MIPASRDNSRPEWHRILVALKYRFIGDAVVSVPFLKTLRQAFPTAFVALFTGDIGRTVLQGCPSVNACITFKPSRSERELRANTEAIRQIRSLHFDTAFLLNQAFHPALLTAMSRVPHRIGFDTNCRGPLLTQHIPLHPVRHQKDLWVDLLRATGVQAEYDRAELWITPEEQHRANEILLASGIPRGSFLVGLQAGSRDFCQEREWGADRFAAVGDRLIDNRQGTVLLFGTDEERRTSEEVWRRMKHKPVVLAGRTTLRECFALISRCGLFIGNDGGLVHAAVALDVPTVGVFHPANAKRWGYSTSRNQTLFNNSPHANGVFAASNPLAAITPDQVFRAASEVLCNSEADILGPAREIADVNEQRFPPHR